MAIRFIPRERAEHADLMRLFSVCQQEPLQNLILSDVAGELHSYSEVCDALSMLEVALGFLAMTGGEPHVQLPRYLEEELQMGSQMAPHILKVNLPEVGEEEMSPNLTGHCVFICKCACP